MGLVSLKNQFFKLTNLLGTADNARAFLVSIKLSPYGYDFRTIVSWTEVIANIRERLNEIRIQEELEESFIKKEEISELEELILSKSNNIKLTWKTVKTIHSFNIRENLKESMRFISLWLHPKRNVGETATKYMSIFQNILHIVNIRIKA